MGLRENKPTEEVEMLWTEQVEEREQGVQTLGGGGDNDQPMLTS
mgnify:CR=1 FL=1